MTSSARTRIEQMREQGRQAIGTMVMSVDPMTTAIAGSVGLDFVVIDMEHGPLTIETVSRHVLAARSCGMIVFVRVLENRSTLIQAAMDAGADGVIAPKVQSVEDAQRLALAVRYIPGGRGACPTVLGAGFSYDNWDDYRQTNNANVLAIPLIETVQGVECVDQIMAVEGIDVAYFGRVDFAQDKGCALDAPEVLQAAISVRTAARAAGKLLMTVQFNSEDADLVVHNADLMLLRAAYNEIATNHRARQAEQRRA
ncbi:hpcH/HpaI aldolase/citrate lyase family protein [Ochrobactrum quorumnocens]|uniref:HpcH/HpaI aldolase/citrate lyase family protein n=1 Tax=Ochrobactrum quorumnocens TaxID=271865 RepID=A0A248UDI6_9HYPH|nr:aldolase/citrate lyase family protein [[Ochrobactrum] quorumnocens]ASV84887.1 hpcH/HpaI aldolase/citrate lyase family protein [[Ochrobactrum] quorumnocens]